MDHDEIDGSGYTCSGSATWTDAAPNQDDLCHLGGWDGTGTMCGAFCPDEDDHGEGHVVDGQCTGCGHPVCFECIAIEERGMPAALERLRAKLFSEGYDPAVVEASFVLAEDQIVREERDAIGL